MTRSPAFCLDHLSLADLDALTLIHAAADAGFAAVSLFVTPVPISPTPDLVADKAARRAVMGALRDRGLRVGIVEPFMLEPAPDWDVLERTAELTAELGGNVNILGLDEDEARLRESFDRMAAICRKIDVPAVIEPYPLSAVRSPAQALDIALTLGPGVGLCIDTLHVIRSGSGWDDVAALPPERIRHVQMNDGPLEAPHDRVNEAVFDRLMPGQGAFNLKELLPLLPDHAMIAVEAPSRVLREGEPGERAARLMQSMRDVYGAA